MIILGIDPGLARIGWGILEFPDPRPDSTEWGSFSTSSRDPLPKRLKEIHDTLADVIARYKPQAASVEDIFFAANVKTAVSLAYGRGAAVLALASADVPLFDYSPLQIKQSVVGYGRAGKEQVQMMVQHLIGMKEAPKSEHANDALAAALCHGASLKRRTALGNLPEEQEGPPKDPRLLLARRRRRRR